jgi:hypothetical protein
MGGKTGLTYPSKASRIDMESPPVKLAIEKMKSSPVEVSPIEKRQILEGSAF